MSRRIFLLFTVLLAISVCLTPAAADATRPSVGTLEQVGDIIYYRNGTVACGPGGGTLAVHNPAASSPLSAVNVTLLNGSTIFVGRIDPSSSYTVDYALAGITIPLKLKETITPSSLASGVPGQLRLCVQVENAGDANITGFIYQKALPPGLSVAWRSNTGGVLSVNDTVTWTLDTLRPGETENIAIAFNLVPSSGIYFPEAYVWSTYGASLTGRAPGFEGNTDTTFGIQKSKVSEGIWHVEARVPDDSEFSIDLNRVTLYRSNAADPFAVTAIASYTPGMALEPGGSWGTALNDNFDTIPAYFIKVAYSIPFTLEQASVLQARTEPVTIGVYTPTPTAWPYNPYTPPAATTSPAVTPTPTASPPIYDPDIVFITPASGDVITSNTTGLETSVPPYRDPGYVAYYGSADNKTWIKLGESPVEGNISLLTWAVPRMNGKYYLKAEHYGPFGLMGVAFTQVLIAHEILPVDVTTRLISGTDLLMLFLALIALLLLLFIIMPHIGGKPVIYDSSALSAVSKDKDWLSKIPRRTIRPDEVIFEIGGVDRIKMKPLRNIEEMRRLEREFSLKTYDAMALQLAVETGATLYTADPRIADIGKGLGIKVKLSNRIALTIKH